MPASIPATNFWIRSCRDVNTAAASPYGVPLATKMASSASRTDHRQHRTEDFFNSQRRFRPDPVEDGGRVIIALLIGILDERPAARQHGTPRVDALPDITRHDFELRFTPVSYTHLTLPTILRV